VRHLGGAGEIKHQAVPLPILGRQQKAGELHRCGEVQHDARIRLAEVPERIEVIPLFFKTN